MLAGKRPPPIKGRSGLHKGQARLRQPAISGTVCGATVNARFLKLVAPPGPIVAMETNS